MTPPTEARTIVVGYDGSPAARAALARAAERAGEDGRVYLVHAYHAPADWLGHPNYQRLLDAELDRARGLVERVTDESGADLHGVSLEVEIVGDHPALAIASVASAREADEIIVGTRGFGRGRALLGSVAHELIHLAECPVTVIPERAVEHMAEHAKALAAS
jgi:nucleotide-binding universal stress UspA family protein